MDKVLESITKSWDEYPVDSLDEFFEEWTDCHSRFICLGCGGDYRTRRDVRECFSYHHDQISYDWESHLLRVIFASDGRKYVETDERIYVSD